MSNIVHKIKEAVHSDKHEKHASAPEGTQGPHSSRTANAMDPRVDSDRDNSATVGTGRTAGHGEYGSSTTGYGTGNTYGSSGTREGEFGPHGSRVANAMDPRVDSDRDNSATVGGTGSNTYGSGNTYGTGNTYGSSGTREGEFGPHGSRVANAMDPRVDSDRDNSATFGSTGRTTGTGAGFGSSTGTGFDSTGTTTGASGYGAGSGVTGMTGTHGAPEGTYGPHGSRTANAMDPRVDSDRDGRGAIGTGPGPADNTAGPYKSDLANKMDPRVDSDLDGSRTVGGNKTYQSGSSYANRDPTDAAQVPPSVLKKHLGDPSIEHDDHTHHRERRNSVKTHQETFSGI